MALDPDLLADGPKIKVQIKRYTKVADPRIHFSCWIRKLICQNYTKIFQKQSWMSVRIDFNANADCGSGISGQYGSGSRVLMTKNCKILQLKKSIF